VYGLRVETLLPYSTAMRRALLHRGRRSSPILLLAGVAAAATAAVAAPPSPLLPAPVGPTAVGVATAVLAVGFALGLHWPLHALYGVVALTIAEGAVRRWAVNDLTVFLLKDFLLVGVYAAVLPRLRRAQLRRPWWLLAPLAGLIALALLHVPRSESLAQAVIGIRSCGWRRRS
jgi:hypothetical protein